MTELLSSQFSVWGDKSEHFLVHKLHEGKEATDSQFVKSGRVHVVAISNRTSSMVLAKILHYDRILPGQCSKHLDCSLAVAKIMDLLFLGDICNVFESCWEVVLGHFLPGEVPIGGRGSSFDGIVDVSFAIDISSGVANPDIVSSIGNEQAWGQVFLIDHEVISCVEETMLEIDWLKAGLDLGVLGLDSEKGIDVSVGCGDVVGLTWVFERTNSFGELHIGDGWDFCAEN